MIHSPDQFTLYERSQPPKVRGKLRFGLKPRFFGAVWQWLHRPLPMALGMTASLLLGLGVGGYVLSVRQTVAAMTDERAMMEASLSAELNRANLTIAETEVALDEKIGQYHALQAQIESKEKELALLQTTLADLNSKAAKESVRQIQAMYSALEALQEKAKNYAAAGIQIADLETAYGQWKEALFNGEVNLVMSGIAEWDQKLQERFDTADSYHTRVGRSEESLGEIQTAVGRFAYSLIKAPINGTVVETVSATLDGCKTDCAVASLSELVAAVGGVAGVNGTYFCPPDYSACAKQRNFTFSPLFESRIGQWVDSIKRLWNHQAGIGFAGNQPTFYPEARDMPLTGLAAGIANYPGLLNDGQIVASAGNTDAKQRIKATRAGFGFDGEWYYLVVVKHATVVESAHVMQVLGARFALTLDGGGSAALYRDSRYLVGPGRLIPNAIVLK